MVTVDKEELKKLGATIHQVAKGFGRAIRLVKLEMRLGDIDRAACDFVEGRTRA